jgi:hypothetical protein
LSAAQIQGDIALATLLVAAIVLAFGYVGQSRRPAAAPSGIRMLW